MTRDITRRSFLRAGGLAVAAGAASLTTVGRAVAAAANDGAWKPTRQTRIISPYSAGGGSDVFARIVAKAMQENDSTVNAIVENRTGGSGAVGFSYVVSQKGNPDVLLSGEVGGLMMFPLADKKLPYKWNMFTPIAQLVTDSDLIMVRSDSPYKSLGDLVAAAKSKKLTIGLPGVWGIDTISYRLIEQSQGVEFSYVIFNGGGEVRNALLNHQVEASAGNPSEMIGQIRSGDLRPLAVVSDTRLPGDLKDVPTFAEAGIKDVDTSAASQFRAIFATGGITPAQRAYWEKTIVACADTDTVAKYIETNSLTKKVRYGAELDAYLEKVDKTLSKIIV